MNKFRDLVSQTVEIARVWGLHTHSDEESQKVCAVDEIVETMRASNTEDEMMEIGDIIVCIVNASWYRYGDSVYIDQQDYDSTLWDVLLDVCCSNYEEALGGLATFCKSKGYSLENCFGMALNKISKRKGMMVGKKWTKYEDLTTEQQKEYDDRDSGNVLLRGV